MTLSEGDTFDVLEGVLLKVGQPKSGMSKAHKKYRVASATFKSDETGEIELALWGTDADRFRAGDKVLMKNITVKSFRDVLSLSIAPPSKGGSIEVRG